MWDYCLNAVSSKSLSFHFLKGAFLVGRVHVGDTANVVPSMAVDSRHILSAPVVIHDQVNQLSPFLHR